MQTSAQGNRLQMVHQAKFQPSGTLLISQAMKVLEITEHQLQLELSRNVLSSKSFNLSFSLLPPSANTMLKTCNLNIIVQEENLKDAVSNFKVSMVEKRKWLIWYSTAYRFNKTEMRWLNALSWQSFISCIHSAFQLHIKFLLGSPHNMYIGRLVISFLCFVL